MRESEREREREREKEREREREKERETSLIIYLLKQNMYLLEQLALLQCEPLNLFTELWWLHRVMLEILSGVVSVTL